MKKSFIYGSGKISYYDEGEGDAIVLVHGYLETSEVYRSFARKLSERFRVISVDLPGHGGSDSYGDTHTMEFMAAVINDLAGNTVDGKIFLTGHSMGGYVTLAFADLFPEKLSGYCLFHSHPFPDTPEVIKKRKMEIRLINAGKWNTFFADNIKRMYAAGSLEKFSSELERSREIASTIPDKAVISVLNGMMARPSRLSVMEGGKVPLLWILGAGDNYIDYRQIQTRVKLPPNAEVFVLENSGHMGFIEEEAEALKKLSEFVTGTGSHYRDNG
ncbi:MAG TPA: alpha/beta hydrolase [Bacteroidales bacterium]|jgi:pimeloyl-ACP methyl ester carboxylesterase|nr:alpha/beta hydrolase [Bacteroidales bacterium]HQH24376.1 alpha/beta hydrolase [Bacteroidales bacterium]HQJ81491.1 alpha/beta hydrolase [Bacteroidales bacterium]